jgi:hypothetical protein
LHWELLLLKTKAAQTIVAIWDEPFGMLQSLHDDEADAGLV